MQSGLTEIVIPKNVKCIEKSAFNSCTSLKSITLNEGIQTIGEYCFAKSGLENVKIPGSI